MMKVSQAMSQLLAYENYDNMSTNNEVIAKTNSAFLKFGNFFSESKMAALRRSLCLMLTIFTQKQLWRLQILKSCQNILHNFYKDGYIQSKVGCHIITGVP